MKDFRAVKTELACYAVIIFAAFLMGFAIKNLYDPVNLVTGGVSGMATVVAITSVSIQEIPNYFRAFGFGYGDTQQYSSEGSGSGIIVGENDDELLIATNNHVVDGATTLSVCFAGNDHCRR